MEVIQSISLFLLCIRWTVTFPVYKGLRKLTLFSKRKLCDRLPLKMNPYPPCRISCSYIVSTTEHWLTNKVTLSPDNYCYNIRHFVGQAIQGYVVVQYPLLGVITSLNPSCGTMLFVQFLFIPTLRMEKAIFIISSSPICTVKLIIVVELVDCTFCIWL